MGGSAAECAAVQPRCARSAKPLEPRCRPVSCAGPRQIKKGESVVEDDDFEDEAFDEGEEDVEDDGLGLDEIDELDELDEEFEDDEADDLVLDDDVDADIVVADDEELDEDDEEEDAELEDDDVDDEDDEEGILGFGEKALAEDELLDFVDDTKEDLGVLTVPIGEGEFTCRSCFLVKNRAQLADEKKMICLDCA